MINSPRPTSPHRASRQHLEGTGVQRLTICRAVLATVDALRDLVELASIGHGVEPPARPKPRCRHARVLRFLQQLGLADKVQAQCFAARFVVGAARDLDQATAAKLGAVARLGVAELSAAFVTSCALVGPQISFAYLSWPDS